ncbi:DUF2949 domain-containing protein [Dolichospermum sp. ST_con]|nr:DUF2949 domain-containing protein [Dolichospermum sp. ST_con]
MVINSSDKKLLQFLQKELALSTADIAVATRHPDFNHEL